MEEDNIREFICSCCKKNKGKVNDDCLKFFIEIDGQTKTYGCSNYESILEKRNDYYLKQKEAEQQGKLNRKERERNLYYEREIKQRRSN